MLRHREALGEAAAHEQEMCRVLSTLERAREPPTELAQSLRLPGEVRLSPEEQHTTARAGQHVDASPPPRAAYLQHAVLGPVDDVGHRELREAHAIAPRSRKFPTSRFDQMTS